MKFIPKTDDEIAREGLCPEGWHEAVVETAKDARSKKSGEEMIELSLVVYTENGERKVRDWLIGSFPKKLKHFCDATGRSSEYTSGSLTADHCEGQSVMVEIAHKEQKTGEYAGQVQANVKDYRRIERHSAKDDAHVKGVSNGNYRMPSKPAEITPDDVPF